MSVLTALAGTTADVLAQIEDYAPEAPPGVKRVTVLVQWLKWLCLLSGVASIIFAGGRFAWEKWHGGMLESPKMVLGALIGGLVGTSAAGIMNAIVAVG